MQTIAKCRPASVSERASGYGRIPFKAFSRAELNFEGIGKGRLWYVHGREEEEDAFSLAAI